MKFWSERGPFWFCAFRNWFTLKTPLITHLIMSCKDFSDLWKVSESCLLRFLLKHILCAIWFDSKWEEMKTTIIVSYFCFDLCRCKRRPNPWTFRAHNGVRRKEEVETLWELHWRSNISPKIYRSSPPNTRHLRMVLSVHTAGRRTSPKLWISTCTAPFPKPNLLLKHPQRPKRSWAGAISISTWKQ